MEYVAKVDVQLLRTEFVVIIEKVREIVRKKKITFTYIIIGSAKRNMVLRHHNKGFDCDYKIDLQKNEEALSAMEIKRLFIDAFNEIIVQMGYNHCEDSTQAISIKKVATNASIIETGYDVIITKEYGDGVHILRNDKKEGIYHFTLIRNTKNFQGNFKKIVGIQMWNDLRLLYKEKREKAECAPKESKKKGFQVLSEAVNEILVKYNLE